MTFRLLSAAALVLVAACSGGGTGTDVVIGVPASINVSTSPSSTAVVGSSAGVFAVKVLDASGKAMPATPVSFSATGGATTTPSSATTDASGLAQTTVTLGPTAGPVTVRATVTGTTIQVDASITATAPVSASCLTLAVGTIVTYSNMPAGCVSGTSAGAEFALVAYNAISDGSSTLTATITGSGLAAAPTTSMSPLSSSSASRTVAPIGGAVSLVPDEVFHLRQMVRAQAALRGKADGARAWYAARAGSAAASGARRNVIPASPTVGQIVSLNVNGDYACDSARYRGARIMAVGTKSVVMADTLNPTGGFTTADYQRFADRFDTIVYPLDTDNFGTPSDIDGNGRVGILFTGAVNEMTPAGANSYVGGFFFARDLYPNTASATLGACAGSNVGEMFYMLVPDPQGKINGNVRRVGFVDTLTTGVLAHEFQHLINASRRLFVTKTAADETTWLNEGLSHAAEELLYYRESGKGPRQNLSGDDVYTNSRSTYPFFKADAASNFSRLTSYLSAPGANSPVIDNDDLATRGSTWSFLRYAVDQVGGSEAAIWTRFDNSTTSGWASLQFALGQDPAPLLRGWALANYLDDLGVSSDAHFQHPSWNFRSVYGTVFGSYDPTGTIFTPMGYPLSVTRMADNTAASVSVRGGSASYYRFAVGAGRDATLSFSSGGQVPNAALQFNVVRTK